MSTKKTLKTNIEQLAQRWPEYTNALLKMDGRSCILVDGADCIVSRYVVYPGVYTATILDTQAASNWRALATEALGECMQQTAGGEVAPGYYECSANLFALARFEEMPNAPSTN